MGRRVSGGDDSWQVLVCEMRGRGGDWKGWGLGSFSLSNVAGTMN